MPQESFNQTATPAIDENKIIAQPLLFTDRVIRRLGVTLFMFTVDVLAVNACLVLSEAVFLEVPSLLLLLGGKITMSQNGMFGYVVLFMGISIIHLLSGLFPGYGKAAVDRIRIRYYTAFFFFGLLFVINFSVFGSGPWAGPLLVSLFFVLIFPVFAEIIAIRILARKNLWGRPILLYGAGNTGRIVAGVLKREIDLGLMPVGFVDDDPETWGKEVEGYKVLGGKDHAISLKSQIPDVAVCIPSASTEFLSQICQELPFKNIIIIPDLFGIQSAWIMPRDLGGIVGLSLRKNLLLRSNIIIKRVMDYIIGIPAFIVAMTVMGLAMAAVKLANPGPALFIQQRTGKNGVLINVYKIRTMVMNAEAHLEQHLDENPDARAHWQAHFKLQKDPRVIPVIGHFLRRYSIDELPQLWNVIRGDMSLIGPRPFPEYHLQEFSSDFLALRRSVLPGVSGLWQVTARSNGNIDVQETLDSYYIRNWSLWLDIHILMMTLWSVLRARGAH